MKPTKKELKVPAIKEGTVIDHIPSRVTFKVMRILDLKEFEHVISVVLNLKSKSMGKKGIIKVGNRFLTQDEVNKIAILAPYATINIIKNYEVIEKSKVEIPEESMESRNLRLKKQDNLLQIVDAALYKLIKLTQIYKQKYDCR